MAYIRLGPDSDICLRSALTDEYLHAYECWGCLFSDGGWDSFPVFTSKTEVMTHLTAHMDAGHKVPTSVYGVIREDHWVSSENGPEKTGG